MQIKLTIDDRIAEELTKEAETMGLTLHAHIKVLLGQHIAKKEKLV